MPVLTGTTMEKSKISSYGIDMNGTDLKKFPANSRLISNSNKSPVSYQWYIDYTNDQTRRHLFGFCIKYRYRYSVIIMFDNSS